MLRGVICYFSEYELSIHYVFVLFSIQEKRVREIVLKAMGQAISKTVAIAEIIKVGAF